MLRIRIAFISGGLFAALTAAACTDGVPRLSPSGPTPGPGALTSDSDMRSTSGGVVDRTETDVHDGDMLRSWTTEHGWAMADGLAVEGTDVITAVTGACPSVVITVRGVPVAVNSATVFSPDASCAGLVVGRTVTVRGLLTVTVGAFSVLATNVRFPDGSAPTREEEVAGTVLTVMGVCPALTMTLEGAGGVVLSSATTTFLPADSCSSIAAGTRIEAKGARNATGQLVATRVHLENEGGSRRRRVSGEGTVGHLTGTCPNLSMVVRGIHVTTSAATVFARGACENLRPGTKVAVEGDTQADGSVRATLVRITDQPGGGHGRVSGEGAVGSLRGVCPILTMIVQGHSVMTSEATVFTGDACSDIRVGVRIEVNGTNQGNSILADTVRIGTSHGGGRGPDDQ